MALGVRGKLLLAVSVVAAMTIVAGAVSWTYYARLERRLIGLLDDNIPSISLALKLSEASGRYAAGAPTLIGAQNNTQRQNVDIALKQQALSIRDLMAALRRRGHDEARLTALNAMTANLETELVRLNLLTERRIGLERRRRALTLEVDASGRELAAALRKIDNDRLVGALSPPMTAVLSRLYEIANAETLELLTQRRDEALADMLAPSGGSSGGVNDKIVVRSAAWGEDLVLRLAQAQEENLRLRADISATARTAGEVAGRLSAAVAQFVDDVEAGSESVRVHATAELSAARLSLAGVALLTFLGPVAFVWALIGRRIVTPLTALAASARAVASGDMTAEIPKLGRDEIGQMADALTAFRDATAQLAERTAELAAGEARLRSILDASVYPIVIAHADSGVILFCNDSAARLFASLDCGAPFPDLDAWAAIGESLWPNGRSQNLELAVRRPADAPFWALVSAVSMVYQNVPATLASFLDISDRKEAERQLRQARDEAQAALESLRLAQQQLVQSEKMASLGQLVAGVAHEINTPLGIALTSASYLSDETVKLTKTAAEGRMRRIDFDRYVANINETTQLLLTNVARAADLVHSFKQVSADQTSDSRRNFLLKQYLDDVTASLKPSWRKAGHVVTVDCPEELTLDGYPGALSQILANLLMNALLHAYDDGQTGYIVIAAAAVSPDVVELSFADDGKGVPAAVQGKVFDPFFTTRRGSGSTGLGLNIIYNLVTQKMGGAIRLESEEGGGARFVMTLPRHAPDRYAAAP